MKVLFDGLGSIGRRHLHNLAGLRPGVEVLACRRRGRDSAPLEYPVRAVPSLADGLAEQPDLAVIATPTALHLDAARAVIEAGVPLLLEKPVTDGWAGVVELVCAAEQRNLPVAVGFNLRFHEALQQARQRLLDGAVGRVVSLRASVGQYLPEWHPGEDYRENYSAKRAMGGGAILDLVHEIDLARWFLGPVASVQAMAGQLGDLQLDTEDLAEILLGHRERGLSSVHVDYLRRPARRTLEVLGTEGTLEVDLLTATLRVFEARRNTSWETTLEPWERNDMYRALMRNVLEVLEGRAAPGVGLREGAEVQRLAVAARRAAISGRAVDVTGPIEEWRDE